MAVKLAPRLRRFKEFCGVQIATTGLPMAYATEVAAMSSASQGEQAKWLSTRFLEILPRCVFVVPEGQPQTATGLDGVDGSDLDMDSVTELFLFVCGMEGSAVPLAPSAATPPAERSV